MVESDGFSYDITEDPDNEPILQDFLSKSCVSTFRDEWGHTFMHDAFYRFVERELEQDEYRKINLEFIKYVMGLERFRKNKKFLKFRSIEGFTVEDLYRKYSQDLAELANKLASDAEGMSDQAKDLFHYQLAVEKEYLKASAKVVDLTALKNEERMYEEMNEKMKEKMMSFSVQAMEMEFKDKLRDKEKETERWRDKFLQLEEKAKKDKKISAEKVTSLKEELDKTLKKGKEKEKSRKDELRKKDEIIEKYKKQTNSAKESEKGDWVTHHNYNPDSLRPDNRVTSSVTQR